MVIGRSRRLARNLLLGIGFCAVAAALGAAGAGAKEEIKAGVAVALPGDSFWELAIRKNLAPDLEIELSILEDPLLGHSILIRCRDPEASPKGAGHEPSDRACGD